MNTAHRKLVFFARKILELQFLRPVRIAISLREASHETRLIQRQSAYSSVRAFDLEALRRCLAKKPDADTLFILGSGRSISDLRPSEFERIGTHWSVGVNNWGVHSFIPDLYALEHVPSVGDGKDFERAINLLQKFKCVRRCPPVLVLRPSSRVQHRGISKLLELCDGDVFYYGRVAPATRRYENLGADLAVLLQKIMLGAPGVFVDTGASVVRLVGLGLALGCRKIVLTGVDLNDTSYFWEDNPHYRFSPENPAPINNQTTAEGSGSPRHIHETMDTRQRAFSVLHFVRALRPVLRDVFGADLYVSSKKSALASVLPVYRWAEDT